MNNWVMRFCRLAALPVLLAGCWSDDKETAYQPRFVDNAPDARMTMIFGVHPLHNPQRLFQVYQPLIDYLNAHLAGVRLRLEASRNYQDFERKLAGRVFQFALPNPYQTVASRQFGYHVFGKMGDDDSFRGIIIVRKDSPITTPAELRGKIISYPAPTAVAATLLPQWFLHHQGLDVRHDLVNRYVGSQESSIMNAYLGESAAGATWPPPWRAFQKANPEIAAQLEVRWQTEPLVNNALVARGDVDPKLVQQIADLLFGLNGNEDGKAILARMELGRFERANDETYRPVAEFIAAFERTIRPVMETQP